MSACTVSTSFSQNCLPSGISFTSQADIDAFPSNYPNCVEIDGDVTIGYFQTCINGSGTSTDINNLDSLYQLTSVHGNLIIALNSNLIDLTGLDGLINIDNHLRIFCNDNLISLNGLNNLVSVGGTTSIGNGSAGFVGNAKLQNLIGLSNLINPTLSIEENLSFKNFTGLNSASSLQTLIVKNCDSLENFVGLENVITINSNFTLARNNSNFDFVGLNNLSSIGGNFFLDRNDHLSFNGLNNLTEIEGGLDIFESQFITDLSGLSNLTTIESFTLVFSNSLTSLNGLNNWSSFASPTDLYSNTIDLFNNASLNDISAISFLDTTGLDDLQIVLNSTLSECDIDLVCNFLDANADNTLISDNMPGCDSNAEVESACSILPVTYSKELRAYKQNNSITLEFSLAQQINNSHFDILHSVDGILFTAIGTILGEGNSSIEKEYLFIHEKPQIGINYYTIKQVDLDGNFSFSRISSVIYETDSPILIYPNPAKDYIYINNKKEKGIYIYTSHGVLVMQDHIDQFGIDISHLDNGVYFYSIEGMKGKFVLMN